MNNAYIFITSVFLMFCKRQVFPPGNSTSYPLSNEEYYITYTATAKVLYVLGNLLATIRGILNQSMIRIQYVKAIPQLNKEQRKKSRNISHKNIKTQT